MKKHAMLALALAMTFALSACGEDKPPTLEDRINQAANSEAVLSYEGVLQSVDLSVYQQGTHQINTGDQTVLIQSARFNLNNYLGKKVEVTGTNALVLGNSDPVMNVSEIRLLEMDFSQVTDYESETNQFKLRYPESWDLKKENKKLHFILNETTIGNLTIFDGVKDIKTFAEDREGQGGTRVTVANQTSYRYNDGDSFRVYIHNKPAEIGLLVHFNQENFKEEKKREAIYELIRSIELQYDSKVTTGPTCGGPENIQCPIDERTEYVCQLEEHIPITPQETPSENEVEPATEEEEDTTDTINTAETDDLAEEVAQIPLGICVPKNSGACPLISPPECNGAEAYVSQYNEFGCPSMFSCPSPDQSSLELSQEELIKGLTEVEIMKQDNRDNPEPENIELMDDPAEGENGDEPEEGTFDVPEVSSLTDSFEVSRQNFRFYYPKSWYFSNLANEEGTQLLIGLHPEQFWSNEEGDENEESPTSDDVTLTLSIINKEQTGLSAGYTASKSRDENTEYRIQGPKVFQQVIDEMLVSIEDIE